jgi:putative peptidoglycan lipid II flippase
MNPDTVSTSEHLARSASVTGAATLASRVLGLARDQVLAALFGAGNEMDAFNVAFRIPNLVRDLFAEGAMSSAFVPTFTRYLTMHGKRDAWRLANNVLNALLLMTGVLAIAGMLFARPLVTLYAGSYATVPGKLELTVQMTRVMLPFLVAVAVAAAAMGMLNSLHHFFWPAAATAIFNIVTIVCAFTLGPLMPAIGEPRIMAIAIAAVLGGAGLVAVQWPSLRREGFRYEPVLDPGDPGLRQVLMLMGPGALGMAATQVSIFVNTLLATTQGTGAVSWLSYAFRLMYLPIGLFGVSIGTAVLPAVSRHAAADDAVGIRDTLSRGLALMLMVSIPATLGLLVLATPIVRALFERGQFLPSDTSATASAVRCYTIGLIGYSTARIASPTFYAFGRSRIPVFVSVGTIALNVVLSLVLVRLMGFAGLALSTSIAALANGATLVWLLRQHLRGIEGRRLMVVLVKVACAAVVMAFAAFVVEGVMNTLVPGAALTAQVVRLAASIGGALTVLGVTAKLLRIAEFDEMLALFRARVQKLLSGYQI